jgi:hypothetical protein
MPVEVIGADEARQMKIILFQDSECSMRASRSGFELRGDVFTLCKLLVDFAEARLGREGIGESDRELYGAVLGEIRGKIDADQAKMRDQVSSNRACVLRTSFQVVQERSGERVDGFQAVTDATKRLVEVITSTDQADVSCDDTSSEDEL